MKNRKSAASFASYRLFKLLLFLSEHKATVKDIISYLEDIDPESKTYSHITIYKYLNSLKAMNIVLERDNENQYFIENIPFKLNLSKSALSSLKYLSEYSKYIEEERVKKDIKNILLIIQRHLNEKQYKYFNELNINDIKLPRIYSENEKELIKNFEKFIKLDSKICVSFKENRNTIKRIIVTPVDIEYKENNVYFIVSDITKAQNISIELEKIIEIEQTPQKSIKNTIPITVIFKIKGRLKNRYILKKYEKYGEITETEAFVINRGEDKDKLIKRLIGYTNLCEIVSPQAYKNDMIEELDTMLKNYE
ncbi:hypothetical protein IJ818_04700 [bacterium]|nr:hypothetical protein [bacterium]